MPESYIRFPFSGPEAQAYPIVLRRRTGLRVSKKGFMRICRDNKGARMTRAADGHLLVAPMLGAECARINAAVTAYLCQWAHETGGGMAFGSIGGFELPNGMIHAPDASWVSPERCEEIKTHDREWFTRCAPDFQVELHSGADRIEHVRWLISEFVSQGTRLAWLIDTRRWRVEIYRPGQPVEVLTNPETLSGEEVLPGFVLKLKRIRFD